MEGKDTNLKQDVRFSKVRRRLFAEDDDNKERLNGEQENNLNIIFEEARQKREDGKKRWNFDFEKGEPLISGRYEWIKVDRDGNEISDSVKQNKGVQVESAEETSKSVTKEAEKTEESDHQTNKTAQ